MVKTLQMFFFGTDWPVSLKLGIHHRVLEYYRVCSNDGPRLTFDLFTQRSTVVLDEFVKTLKWCISQKVLKSTI